MLSYLPVEQTNPYFSSNCLDKQLVNAPYYTDTDSIQIHQNNLPHLTLNNAVMISLGDNCKILFGAGLHRHEAVLFGVHREEEWCGADQVYIISKAKEFQKINSPWKHLRQ